MSTILAPRSPASTNIDSTVPRYARAFVALFLVAVIVCPVAAVNLWPFSSWRLFSALRPDRQTSWQAIAVDAAGSERDYPIASMPHGYGGFRHIMVGFSSRAADGRDAVCNEWLRRATKDLGPGTTSLRIYGLSWRVSDRQGARSAPPQRTLKWICSENGARAAA